jgi:hypothetical protein
LHLSVRLDHHLARQAQSQAAGKRMRNEEAKVNVIWLKTLSKDELV